MAAEYPDRFVLEVRLGNDAMRAAGDVSSAVYEVSEALCALDYDDAGSHDGIVRDANGNRVGRWTLARCDCGARDGRQHTRHQGNPTGHAVTCPVYDQWLVEERNR